MKRVLVLGASGQVGLEISKHAWRPDCELVLPSSNTLDLRDAKAVKRYVSSGDFDLVINSGAYTAVDKAEVEIEDVWLTNALGPAALAEATRLRGIPLLHLSTDYVFDGKKQTPYETSDPVAPLNVYGASKEAGEQAVRTGNPDHVILRTAWVFSRHRSNFVKTMLRLCKQGVDVRVVTDQMGNPTSAQDIASALVTISTRFFDDKAAPRGTYHFVNKGDATWYEFARTIFERRVDQSRPPVDVHPISTREYPTPARRPQNSRLDAAALERDFGIVRRHWRDALDDVLLQLEGEA